MGCRREDDRLRDPERERLRLLRYRAEPKNREAIKLRRVAKLARLTQEERASRRKRSLDLWRSGHPESYRAYHRAKKHRRRLLTSGVLFTVEDLARIHEAQHGKCAYYRVCRTMLDDDYHIDHVVPICLGGSGDRANLQLTCPACNLSKHGQHPADFARRLGLLI